MSDQLPGAAVPKGRPVSHTIALRCSLTLWALETEAAGSVVLAVVQGSPEGSRLVSEERVCTLADQLLLLLKRICHTGDKRLGRALWVRLGEGIPLLPSLEPEKEKPNDNWVS